MSRTVPPIPPPLGTNTGNPTSPNITNPIPVETTNNTTTNNVVQNVKDRFLVYLDGLEPYLIDILENGPFVSMSRLSTSTNPLTKPQKQWSPEDKRLVNQDKTLKIIIISCLLNDVMKSVIKCTTAKAIWTGLISVLRLKFIAFKALEGEKVNGTFTRLKCLLNDLENNGVSIPQAEDSDLDVEEDTMSSSVFLANLNAEFHDKALLANQMRFYKRSKRVGSTKKLIDKSNETCFAYGKLGSRGKKKDTISSKEVLFCKEAESLSETVLEVTSDSKSECDNLEPLPPLLKLIGAEPIGTSTDVLYLANLTLTTVVSEEIKKVPDKRSAIKAPKKKVQTMSPFVPDFVRVKKANSSTQQLLLTLMEEVKGIKEKIKIPSDTSPFVSQSGSSKSAKDKQKTWFGPCKHCGFRNHLLEDCYMKPKCSTCESTDHLTKEHHKQVAIKKTLAKLKARSSQGSSSRKALMIPKPFIDCKYYCFNDHHSDEYEYYPGCDICGSIAYETANYIKKPASNKRKPRIASQRSNEPYEKWVHKRN
ncbi:hypothetical protein Tco_0218960 [Tanacetum coccineum]